jgi:SH3-like domain-containing protein
LWRKAANIPRSFTAAPLFNADVQLLARSLFVRGDFFMPKLITFSCFILFWVFYEISGGSDFTPRERVIVSQAPFAKNERGSTFVQRPTNEQFVVTAVYTPVVTSPLEAAEATVDAPVITPAPAPIDLRYVAANRVNLRTGPSTTDPVIDTITRGVTAEIITLNGDGWAQIRLTDSGQTGWMAARLLSEG